MTTSNRHAASPPAAALAADHAEQVRRGDRFAFGANWERFLSVLSEDRIEEARISMKEMLGVDALAGKSFIDVGSGSGLFSLAAFQLGASAVKSFDFDTESVACTAELHRRYGGVDGRWTVEQGSILDAEYVGSLGTHDIVYSWGVLHHTGAMWDALDQVDRLVAPSGTLFISIYNDQGFKSRLWRRVKRIYNALPDGLRLPFAVLIMVPREFLSLGMHTVQGRPLAYVRTWTQYKRSRGMSRWHDIIDWIGGYPFEVAKPEQIIDWAHERGFRLARLTTVAGSLGCNQYVLVRAARA